jgi:hypothetical protein
MWAGLGYADRDWVCDYRSAKRRGCLEFVVAGEAENGQEAIDMAGQLSPPCGFNLHPKLVRNSVVGVSSCANTM